MNIEKFLEKTIPEPNSGCWFWLGSTSNGYGVYVEDCANYLAHRVSFSIFKGPLIAGKIICHLCHNRLCVNPEHLIQGTHADNKHHDFLKKRQTQLDYQWWK